MEKIESGNELPEFPGKKIIRKKNKQVVSH